ncbi:MAG: beta-galactosidase [Treponema sp.]|jgi:beta-galactosidase|nr:beta-galactosidase [Treponema sp.]
MSNYLFGAVYIIEQDYTDEEMYRDIKNMANAGYNLITLWPVTNPWLAKSSHEWNFDATRKVLDICQSVNIKAILQLFGQNQAQEFMPDSALTAEMEIHDEYGDIVNENCYWANLNHSVVREYLDGYFRAAITYLKDHPAVFGWDMFNEAHFRSDDQWTIALYQEWLKKKYGAIEKLNYDWYRRYENFSQVRPIKRHSAYVIWSSLLPELDYERFRADNLTDICKWLYDTAKKYDPLHPIILDGTSGQIIAPQITLRNNDEFSTARIPDIYGATFYPKSWGKNYKETPWTASMYFSIPAWAAHKARKHYFVNELQTHTQSALTPGSEVSPFELTSWILMCIFTGAQGFQLWRWRPFLHGYQVTGRGLTRFDGSPNERSEAVANLLKLINSNDVFGSFKPEKPFVKIGMSYDIRLYFDSLLKWKDSFWAKNLEGWYRLFWEAGKSIGFTDISDLDDDDMRTPVLVLPSAIRISEAEARRLTRYVEGGGILVADGRMAAINEKAAAPSEGIPGEILSNLFGLREIDVSSGEYFIIGARRIPAPYMNQKLEVFDGAEVLAKMEDGTPAVVVHKKGEGRTLYINSFMGLLIQQDACREVSNLILSQMPKQGISVQKGQRVHLSFIESDSKKAMLAINFSDSAETIKVANIAAGKKLFEIFSGESNAVEAETELRLSACEAKIYIWDK